MAQAQAPPQSASMPGTLLRIAPSITDRPFFTSTVCSVPSCSMYLIFAKGQAGCFLRDGDTISFLVSAMALAGFRPFGHTWAQFMMVWQR